MNEALLRFDTAVVQAAERQRRLWMAVALLSLLTAGALGAAVAVLIPLKEVQPWVIEVERATGEVRVLTEYQHGERFRQLLQSEALVESELVKYVIAREGFDPQDFDHSFFYVMARSAGDVEQDYYDTITTSATDPRNLYRGMRKEVEVESVSFLRDQTAVVRFDTLTYREGERRRAERRGWSAIVSWAFLGAPAELGERWENPLAFAVKDYRVDQAHLGDGNA